MLNEPNYYDSQATAAAALDISIYDVKCAKRAGCRAFRSGRVYRAELVEWFKVNPITRRAMPAEAAASIHAAAFEIPGSFRWQDRRELLFEIGEFLDAAYERAELSAAEYRAVGNQTIPLILELGRAWNAGIDEPGYQSRWAELRQKHSRKLIAEVSGNPCRAINRAGR